MIDLLTLLRSRIPTVLRGQPQVEDAVEWLADQFGEVQDAIAATRSQTGIADAVGATLDKHGAGLLRPRVGLDDDEYRTELLVKFAALFRVRSPELAADLLAMLTEGSTHTGNYTEWHPAAYEYTLSSGEETTPAATFARWEALLRTAKPEGVRMVTRVVPAHPVFQYDIGRGYDASRYAYTLES